MTYSRSPPITIASSHLKSNPNLPACPPSTRRARFFFQTRDIKKRQNRMIDDENREKRRKKRDRFTPLTPRLFKNHMRASRNRHAAELSAVCSSARKNQRESCEMGSKISQDHKNLPASRKTSRKSFYRSKEATEENHRGRETPYPSSTSF